MAAETTSGSALAWVAMKKDVLAAKITKIRAGLPLPADVAVATAGGCVQGGLLGGVMGAVSKPPNEEAMAKMMTTNPRAAAQMAQMKAMQGSGPLTYARNFAVMTGVHAGVSHLLLKVRGKGDLQESMAASFCSGVAFALVAGVGGPTAPGGKIGSAITTGMFISAFQGIFYKVGKALGDKKEKDKKSKGKNKEDYKQAREMLSSLGLDRYEGNFKKAGLTDDTLRLITDGSLIEAKIPAGPRLLILERCKSNTK